MTKCYRLVVNSNIYELAQVRRWFKQVQELPQSIYQQVELVLTEAFSNVVYHAHEHLPEETPVEIECQLFDDHVELRVWDYGQPFDLFGKKELLARRHQEIFDVDDMPTGGRGLLIMESIADHLSYDRTADGRNCLLIVKNLPAPN
ncbi:MAG: ATP-binding protein [Pseudanabaenaceae cyanobacterium SKYGB_i_bin29]|nr:ATP-binding protein [Pseudanabaenaceae cyanobacterium SKYG29]MDW8422565.1 ATP-binding protein [Pseudanabaenaceae cyanobacterium SKYGB_i_bin29]